jgi:hypothetical protein
MGRRLLIMAACALVTGLLTGMPKEAPAQTTAVQDVDPVVADVVRMLDVGVEPELVLQWLESSGRQPRPLTADDVIALSQAQAPKNVIQALLDMAARPAPPPSATPPPTASPAPGYAAPATPAPAYPAPGGTAVPPAATGPCCLVEFSIEYRAAEDVEGDNTPTKERDLFVYRDGAFLARVSSLGNIASSGPVSLKTQMPPGTHTIRLTRELHARTKDVLEKGAWEHETTVSPVALQVQVEPGYTYNLDLKWVQSEFSTKRPLSWRWSRNGMEVAGEKHTGEFRQKWAWLCEDVEVSRDDGAISNWRARDRLKDCVHWDDLWPTGNAPTRREVLAELQKHDFDPPVSYVGRLD